MAALESRSLLSTSSPITVTEAVTPLKSGGRGGPVTAQVSGTVADSDTGATLNKTLAYSIFNTQTNHQVRSGMAKIAGDGSYSFDVRLPMRRFGRHDSGADQFTVSVMASDSAGNTGTDSTSMTVTPNAVGSGRGQFRGDHGGGGSSRFHLGGPGEDQSNGVSVNGNNDTVTQYVSNYQSNTYNISVTTTKVKINNINNPPGPPLPPPPPPPPSKPGPPGPPAPPPPAPPGPPPPVRHPGPPGPPPPH